MRELDVNRLNHLVDPNLHIWGWEIAGYLFLGGLVAGAMVFSALLSRRDDPHSLSKWVRWTPFMAPVLISLGMFMLLLDLENKLNLYRFYFSFEPTSPMSWGAWILIGIYPGTLAFGIALLAQEEAEAICARLGKFGPKKLAKLRLLPRARQALQPHLATLRTANIVMGIGLGLYTGVLLGTLQARPLWNSTLLGPLFLVSGLSTGAALMMLFPLREGEHDKLRRWDLLAITAELVLLGLFLIDRTTAGEAGLEQATRFFGGDLTAVFWSLVIVAGLVVPMALEIFEKKAGTKPTLAAPALILTGGLALRWIFVFGGQGVIG